MKQIWRCPPCAEKEADKARSFRGHAYMEGERQAVGDYFFMTKKALAR
jgi:hypothetical protein